MAKKNAQKEFDYTTIKSFDDACNHLGIDPKLLPEVSNLPEDLQKPIVAAYKLMIVFKAINNGWTPDWSNRSQYKYYPYFWVSPSGSGFSVSHCACLYTTTNVGSRLCTDTDDKALYIAETFEQEYKDFML